MICTYRVRSGNEESFTTLLGQHWPTLHRLEAVTDEPATVYKSLDPYEPTFVEIFTWLHRDPGSPAPSEHPDVLAIWEKMEQLCEARDGRPSMEFPHFERLHLHG